MCCGRKVIKGVLEANFISNVNRICAAAAALLGVCCCILSEEGSFMWLCTMVHHHHMQDSLTEIAPWIPKKTFSGSECILKDSSSWRTFLRRLFQSFKHHRVGFSGKRQTGHFKNRKICMICWVCGEEMCFFLGLMSCRHSGSVYPGILSLLHHLDMQVGFGFMRAEIYIHNRCSHLITMGFNGLLFILPQNSEES